jgi:phosphoketolase
MDHCLRSRHCINVVVAGRQPAPSWLTMTQAALHCRRGLGIWDWASTDAGSEPDVVLACAGDVPAMEALAATDLLRRHLPQLDRVPGLGAKAAHLRQEMVDAREQCRAYTRAHDADDPSVAEWTWVTAESPANP